MSTFSTGSPCCSASSPSAARARVSRRAATGSRSAHARGSGGPSVRGARAGRSASSRAATVRSAAIQREAYRSAPRPWNPFTASSASRSRGHGLGGGDDRRVGDDPAGGHVAALGQLVAGLPQRLHRAQAATAADPVHPRRTTPGVHAGRGLEGEQALELLPRPLVLAGLDQLCGQRLAELHEHLDVEGGVLQPRLRQRPPRPVDRRVLLLHPACRAPSRPEWRGRRGGSRAAGRPARCRTASPGRRPTSARHGRSWVAACRIQSVPSSASASGASVSKAIGSTSQVPAPSRRSWMR